MNRPAVETVNDAVVRHALDIDCVRHAVDDKKMSATFVIATRQSAPNLHGNKVQIGESEYGKGANLIHHQTAPIVLFEHGMHSPYPIGVSRSPAGEYLVRAEKNRMTGTVFFSQANPEGELVFAMVSEGIVGMASIGFRANKAMRLPVQRRKTPDGVHDLDQQQGGLDFVEWTLVEWSVVARGADPGAVRQVLDRGSINGAKVTPTLAQSLTPYAEPRRVWGAGITAPRQPDLGQRLKQRIEVQESIDRWLRQTPLQRRLKQWSQN